MQQCQQQKNRIEVLEIVFLCIMKAGSRITVLILGDILFFFWKN